MIAIATSVLAVVFFLIQPTFPSYDGYYSLLWAREIVGGSLPNFQLPAAPTEHPAGILLGIGSLAFGDEAERAYVLVVLLSFGALVAGIYSLGAELFNRTVGLVAGLIVLTRFDLVALAVRGFVDIPFLALIIWSAVLVAREPKRTQPAVFVLLTVAGLLRPEAWLFIGIYFLFCSRGMVWGQRVRYAAVVAIGPLVWFTIDWLVTGNPLFSLTATRELAGELGRSRGFLSVLFDLPVLIARTVKMSVLIAGVLGLGIGLHYWRER
ncbi:MAG: glycosyltransferase family 39 protein, partial [Thermoleophilaceae bacterium]|nr:glycosyltransferase family 39 protein [Thermoleophilaceae bacterium]